MSGPLMQEILTSASGIRPFALVARTAATGERVIDVFMGEMHRAETLEGILLPEHSGAEEQALVVIPYRQLCERGFDCVDDHEPLEVMMIKEHERFSVAQVLQALPEVSVELSWGGFDISDDAYALKVQQIIEEEIGRGEGSNFVFKRTFLGQVERDSPRVALTAFCSLLRQEIGAYWTYIVSTGRCTLIGASPERHVVLRDGIVMMNPISGTYRYPETGPSISGVLEFLSDIKERDELFMVVDEELKMMSRFCPRGGRVVGPYLKEMSRLAHTEYLLTGQTDEDPRKILRHTLFAPTVTGSPVENACRVIARHEPEGRRYYGGVIALLGQSSDARAVLDSAIVIRTVDIRDEGKVRLSVGASIVRHSDPICEAAETRTKARALLAALGYAPGNECLEKAPRVSGPARGIIEYAGSGHSDE